MSRVGGIVQKLFKVAQGADQEHRMTSVGSLAVAQTELAQVELTRTGRMFVGGVQLLANAIAPDATMPTTTLKQGLFNGEPDGGRTYFIDHLSFSVASGTPAAGASLFATISNGKLATALTSMATGFGVGPASGFTKHKSAALWGTALTFPAGSIFHLIGANLQLAAANVGMGDQPYELRGGLAIPPGYAMGLVVLSGAGTTPLYITGARWAELEVDLET